MFCRQSDAIFFVIPVLRRPSASVVIYGGLAEKGIAFEGVAKVLTVPGSDIRLFGKPESFLRRCMGIADCNAGDTDEARRRAMLAASLVKPERVTTRFGYMIRVCFNQWMVLQEGRSSAIADYGGLLKLLPDHPAGMSATD